MARKAGAARPARKRTNRRPWFESLESRCLLSADLVPVDLSQPPPELPAPQVISDTLTRNARELVVIDAGVADAGALVDLIRNRTDRPVEVVHLDAEKDGLTQITALLDGRTRVDALHLISHGREGVLQLGARTLDQAALEAGADQLRAWQAALGAEADILLYGCDLAGNAAGAAFMQTLAHLTGADVAASTDATGAATLGADWDLEARVGSVETKEIVDAVQAVHWQHQLALIAEDPFDGSGTLAGSFGGTGWTGTWAMFEGPSNRFRLQPPGLTPAGSMDTPSVSAVYTSSSTDSEVERRLASPIGQDGTTTWIGFLLQAGNTNVSDYTGIVLGGELLGTTTVFAGYTRTGFYIEQQGGALATQVGGLIPVTGQTYRVVLRIQSTALGDTITMYVNPPADDPDSGLGTRATATNLDPGAFARVALASGTGNSALDELRIGTTYADVVLGAVPDGTNSAPELNAAKSPVLAAVDEDAGMPDGAVGTLVSDLVDLDTAAGGLDNVTDPDAGAVTGIAVTGITSTNGSWYYTTDGGTQWLTLDTASDNTALLLAANDSTRVYFKPGGSLPGDMSGTMTFRAWDQSSGTAGTRADTSTNGGSSAFSSATDTVSANVTLTNDAPTLTGGANHTLTATDENTASSGTAVSVILGGVGANDVDSGALRGIAVTSVNGNGTWQYSTDGATWTGFGALGATNALLLAADAQVRYQPDQRNGETAGFGFRAWDQTTGTASGNSAPSTADPGSGGGTTAFSTASATASIVVGSVNDAPALDATRTPADITVSEDAGAPAGAVGTLITALVDLATPGGQVDNVTDHDTGAITGIAVTGTDNTHGTWHFSTDNGTTWTALGTPAVTSARLLAADGNTRVYFQPLPNYFGSSAGALTFRAWDQTSGSNGATADTAANGGSTAFSEQLDTVALTVNAVNDAPSITNGYTHVLPNTDENTTSSSTFVTDIVTGAGWTDADGTAPLGLAVTSTTGNGAWSYSTNGTTWQPFGSVSSTSALLLGAGTRVRYAPDGNNGETASFGFRAWDQSTGTASTNSTRGLFNPGSGGGSSAFSAATASARMTVASVNDAPTLSTATTPVMTMSEDSGSPTGAVGNLVSSIADLNPPSGGMDNVTDPDTGAVTGMAILTTNESNGTWFYTTNGGASWQSVGAVSTTNALLLAGDANTRLYFRPNANYFDTAANGSSRLTFRAWDQTAGTSGTQVNASAAVSGGSTSLSAAVNDLFVKVNNINDAPVASGEATLAAVSQGDTNPSGALVSALFAANFDNTLDGTGSTPLSAAAVIANTADPSHGRWQYSSNGTTWVDVPTVGLGDTSALVLPVSYRLRFLPSGSFVGDPAALTVRLADGSGTSSFSTSRNISLSSGPGSGIGGIGNYSAATVPLRTTVLANTAPVLDATRTPPALSATEDAAPPSGAVGTLVSTLVDFASPTGQVDNVTDPDTGPLLGIAITDASQGTWYFSTNGGSTWTALGTPSPGAARLLAADAGSRLYVQPAANFHGSIVNALTFRAWDRTSGSNGATADTGTVGGTTAFSIATDTVALNVAAINDAPLATENATLEPVDAGTANPPGASVLALFGSSFDDSADAGAAGNLAAVAIVGNAAVAGQGAWQFSEDGVSWTAVPTSGLSNAAALVLPANYLVRFLPATGYSGTPGALSVRVSDGSTASGTGYAAARNIGSAIGGSQPWSVDTIALNTSVLSSTADNQAPRALPVANPASAYDFENAGVGPGSVTSYVPGGATMSLSGSATLAASAARPGSSGSTGLLMTAQMDSTVPQVTLGPLPGAATMTGFTFAGWVRFDGNASEQAWERVFDFGRLAGNNNWLALARRGTSNDLQLHSENMSGGSSGQVTVTNAITAGQWMHVAATVDTAGPGSQTVTVYIGGSAGGTYTISAGNRLQFANWESYRIGASNHMLASDRQFRGAMDDIHLFERALSAAEVARLASTTPVTMATSEGASPVVLDALGSVVDSELAAAAAGAGSYAGATLTLSRNGGAHASDVFSATGTLGPLTQGGSLVVGGTTIGAVTTNSGGTLKLSFDAAATTALLDAAVRQIAYATASDAPPASVQINRVFSDGNTGDQGAGGARTVNSPVTVNIAAVNDAPVLDASRTPPAIAVAEDTGVPSGAVGTLVSTLVDFVSPAGQVDNVTDPDDGAQLGIAITSADTTRGTWYVSIDNGSTWTTLGTPTTTSARLLSANATTRLQFQPNAGFSGSVADALTFRAWDQTSGSNGGTADTSDAGGASAFSAATDTVALNVTPVNDAPRTLPVAGGVAAYDFEGAGTGDRAVASFIPGGAAMSLSGSATLAASAARPGSSGSTGLLMTAQVDSTTPQVTLGPLPGAATMTGFTFAGWVRFDGNGAQQSYERVFDFAQASGSNFLALCREGTSNNLQLHSYDDAGNTTGNVKAMNAIVTGQWMHLAATVTPDAGSGQTVVLYVDGNAAATYTLGEDEALDFSAWTRYRLGASNNGDHNRQFRGAMDDIHLFERGLTASEVARLASTAPVTVATSEGGAPVVLDALGSVVDPELAAAGNYAGAMLTLSRNGGAHASDVFSATGSLGSLTQGGDLVVGGTTIGAVTTNSGGTLKLSFDAAATTALLDAAVRQIAYATASDAPPASVQINRVFNDGNSGAQGSGGALSVNSAITVNIAAVNDSPVLDASRTPPAIESLKNAGAPSGVVGTLVSTLVDFASPAGQVDNVTDPDAGAQLGIAIVGADNTRGDWYFSTNNGSSWTALGSPGTTSARLLAADANTRVYFKPDAGFTGTVAEGLTFRAWDRASGSNGGTANTTFTGGTDPYSDGVDTVALTVAPANGAPRVLPVAGAAAAYDFEGVGSGESTVSSHVAGGADLTLGGSATLTTGAARPGSAEGAVGLLLTATQNSVSPQVTLGPLPGAAAMTGFSFSGWVRFDTNGTGQGYERVFDFASGPGYGWLALARYETTNDLILHSEDNTGADEGSGSVIVADVIQPDEWMHVAATVDTLGSGEQRVTVYVDGVSGGSYDIASGSRLEFANWTSYLLGASNNYPNTDRQFRGAMDDIQLFERALSAAEVARLASTTTPTLAITEGAAPVVPDTLGSVVDPELAAAAAGAGSYAGATLTLSRDGGASASDVFSATGTLGALTQGGNLVVGGTTIGTVTTNSGGTLKLSFNAAATSTLLDTAVRQIAYANISDAPSASVQINRVFSDGNTGAQGAGGALSVNSPVTVNIAAVNDAPLADGEAALGEVGRDETDPAGTTVSALFASLYDDTADGAGATALSAVAIVQNSANAATQGRWQYSDEDDGAWQDVPTTVSDEAALVLPADYRLRFVPASGYTGMPGVLKVRLSDGTAAAGTGFDTARDITAATGGTGPWSNDAVPLGVTVVPVNRAPTLGGANDLPDIDEDTATNPGQTVAALLAGHAADADADSVGIAVTGVDNSHGTWQYSTDGGTTWTAFGTPAPAAARLLGATARVRFVPAADWNGEVASGLSLRAWDGAIGVDGGTADASAGGGRRAFSEATATIGVTVNAMAEASGGDLVLAAAAAGTATPSTTSGSSGSGSTSADASSSGSDAAGSGSRSQSESEASSSARTIMTMSVPRTPASGGRSARSTQGNSRSGDGSNDPDGTPIDPTQGGQTAVVVKDVQGNAGAGVGGNGAALPGFSAAGSTGGTGPALLTQSSGTATLPGSDLPAPTAEALAAARTALADTRWVAGLEKAEEAAREDAKVEQIVMGSGAAVAGSLTVGYASWLLRGGTLLSSLLVSMPAWRMFDPLPVLKRSGLEDGDGTDDPLERLFSRARSALAKPRPADAGTATTPVAVDGSQYSQEVSS